MSLCTVRSFSSTRAAPSVLDYFRFFKKTDKQSSTPAIKPVSNEKAVEIQDTVANDAPKVTILGIKNPRYTDPEIIKQNLNGFVVSKWIPKSNLLLNNDNYKLIINDKLNEIFQKNNIQTTIQIPINDKLNIFKSIQKTFSINIPDYQIANLSNYQLINDYLIKILNPNLANSNITEFTPNAIDLPIDSFKGTNVHIGKHVFEAQKRKTYKKLLKKAASMEKNAV